MGGAYLVICHGDDLFASGMVLITPNQPAPQAMPAPKGEVDYKGNLYKRNDEIQTDYISKWNEQRRQGQSKGVKIEKAY